MEHRVSNAKLARRRSTPTTSICVNTARSGDAIRIIINNEKRNCHKYVYWFPSIACGKIDNDSFVRRNQFILNSAFKRRSYSKSLPEIAKRSSQNWCWIPRKVSVQNENGRRWTLNKQCAVHMAINARHSLHCNSMSASTEDVQRLRGSPFWELFTRYAHRIHPYRCERIFKRKFTNQYARKTRWQTLFAACFFFFFRLAFAAQK